jgi:hypothetical protein
MMNSQKLQISAKEHPLSKTPIRRVQGFVEDTFGGKRKPEMKWHDARSILEKSWWKIDDDMKMVHNPAHKDPIYVSDDGLWYSLDPSGKDPHRAHQLPLHKSSTGEALYRILAGQAYKSVHDEF